MNQILAGTAALALAVVLWSFGRKPKSPLTASADVRSLLIQQLEQNSLVKAKKEPLMTNWEKPSSIKTTWQAPTTAHLRKQLQTQLRNAMRAGPDERLKAITIAGLWDHPSVIPLLRRGIKDSDSRVVTAAAAIIQNKRGLIPGASKSQKRRPPRNVALIR